MFARHTVAAALGLVVLVAAPVLAGSQDHPGAGAYGQVCQLCHGEEGRGNIGPPLVPFTFDADYVLAVVREGYGQMPPISARELSDDDVRQAMAYLEALTAPQPASAGGSGYEGPRTPEGQPDLNGIWQVVNAASWDIRAHNARDGVPGGLGVVRGRRDPVPALGGDAAGRELRQPAHRGSGAQVLPAGSAAHHLHAASRSASCRPPTTSSSRTSTQHAVRIIYTDGSPHPLPNDFWMGDSRGHWEGDTLVVDTTHFNGLAWFDAAGPTSTATQLHVVERYTPTSPYHIDYEVTIEDPEVFTRPWTMRMPLYRRVEDGLQLLDYDCVDFILQALTAPEGGGAVIHRGIGSGAVVALAATGLFVVGGVSARGLRPGRRRELRAAAHRVGRPGLPRALPAGSVPAAGDAGRGRVAAAGGVQPRAGRRILALLRARSRRALATAIARPRPPAGPMIIDPPDGKVPLQPWAFERRTETHGAAGRSGPARPARQVPAVGPAARASAGGLQHLPDSCRSRATW